jgi:outer membrane lipoprotein-sorting protein
MRRSLLVPLVFIALTSVANGETLSQTEVKSLLTRIRENRITHADFQEEKVIRLITRPILSSGKVWFQPPNRFRREVKGNSPSLTVSDGHQLWLYYPNFKSAERYSLGVGSAVDSVVASINSALNLENIESDFQVVAQKIGPQAGYELELTPRTASTKRMFQKLTMLINEKLETERTDMLQPNGDRIVTTYSSQSRAPVPLSTFEFSPPPGTSISTPLGR